jgi:hypothetical protein
LGRTLNDGGGKIPGQIRIRKVPRNALLLATTVSLAACGTTYALAVEGADIGPARVHLARGMARVGSDNMSDPPRIARQPYTPKANGATTRGTEGGTEGGTATS